MPNNKSPSLWDRVKAVASNLKEAADTYLTPEIRSSNDLATITVNPIGLFLTSRTGRALQKGVEGAVVDTVTFVTGDLAGNVVNYGAGKLGLPKVMMNGEEQSKAYHRIKERVTGEKQTEYKEGSFEKGVETAGYWGTNLASMAGIGKAAGKFILKKAFELGPEKMASLARTFGKNADVGALRWSYRESVKAAETGLQKIVENSDKIIGFASMGYFGTSVVEGIKEGLSDKTAAPGSQSVATRSELEYSTMSKASTHLPLGFVQKPGIAPLQTSLNSESLLLARQTVINKVMSPGYMLDAKTGGFDNDKLEKLQELLVESGHLSATYKTGTMNAQTMKAIEGAIRAGLDPSKLTDEQRDLVAQNTNTLFESLHQTPPDGSTFDPRVLGFQVNARFLNIYGGKLDGLAGAETTKAGQQFGAIREQAQTLANPAPAAEKQQVAAATVTTPASIVQPTGP